MFADLLGVGAIVVVLVLALWPPRRAFLWRQFTRPLRNLVRPHRHRQQFR